jgi:Ca2+-binding EF-hand superfamily protein
MYRLGLLGLTLILCAATAFAGGAGNKNEAKKQPPRLPRWLQESADDFIKRFDLNEDGYLTRDELPPRVAALFDQADKNGDGKLDRQEVQALLPVLRKRFGQQANQPARAADSTDVERQVAQLLQRMDTNKDGMISRDEAKGPLAKNFDLLDTNKDGYLDKDELRRAVTRWRAAQKAAAKQGNPDRPGGQRPQQPDFDALDLNADGRLTREELKGTRFEADFDKIDTNKDGKIDRKEFEAYLKKLAEKDKSSSP